MYFIRICIAYIFFIQCTFIKIEPDDISNRPPNNQSIPESYVDMQNNSNTKESEAIIKSTVELEADASLGIPG